MDVFLLMLIIPTSFILFLVTIMKEITAFRKQRLLQNFTFTILFVALMMIAVLKTISVENNFEKPSLLKAEFEDGSIDFKTDRDYIVKTSSLAGSSYVYGKYSLADNKLILDKSNIFNIVVSDILEISNCEKAIDKDTADCLLQIDRNGQIITTNYAFRITIDNRSPM